MKVTIMAIILASAVVQAADGEGEKAARAYFDKGQRLFGERKYLEALAAFSAGYELSHRPAFLFNMGECARLAGETPRARELYRRYLAEDPYGKFVPTARERLAETPDKPNDHTNDKPKPTRETPPIPIVTTPAPVATPRAAVPTKLSPTARPLVVAPLVAPNVTTAAAVERPLWRKWPFWAGIGAVVIGGTVATILATSSGNGDGSEGGESSLPNCGADCQSLDWRP